MAVPSTPLQEIRTCGPIPLIGLNSFIVEQVGSSDKGLNSWGSVDEPMGALSRPLDENQVFVVRVSVSGQFLTSVFSNSQTFLCGCQIFLRGAFHGRTFDVGDRSLLLPSINDLKPSTKTDDHFK